MADVTGDLGGNPIQLNNAATEATLKQLLAAMLAMNAMQAKNTKKDIATQKELEAELRRLAKESKNAADSFKKSDKSNSAFNQAIDKNAQNIEKKIKAAEKEVDASKKVETNFRKTADVSKDVVNTFIELSSSLANMQDSISSSVVALGALTKVGTLLPGKFGEVFEGAGSILTGIFGPVADNAQKLLKSFQSAASVGANFSGSLTELVNDATQMGLTFNQLTGIIQKSSKNLALLGGSTAEGAKRLTDLGKRMKESGVADQLAALGYSTTEINEYMADYAGNLQKTGALQGMTNAQLVQQTGEYLENLDAVSRLTGESRKDLEKQRQDRLKDAQFRLTLSKMDATSQKALHALMDSIPEEHRKGMMEIVATGSATSEAGRAALAFLPDTAKNMMGLNRQINTTGKMSMDQAQQLNKSYQAETQKFVKSGVAENLAKYGTDAQKQFFIGAADAAARQKNLAQTVEEQKKAQEAAKLAEQNGDKLTAAKMQELQRNIAETSNKFSVILASGMPALTTFTDMLLGAAKLLAPALEKLAPHLDLVAGGLIAMMAAIKIAQKIREAKESALAKAMQLRGSNPKNPMWVQDAPGSGGGLGGDVDGPDKGKGKGKGKGKAASKAMGLLKGIGKGALKVIPGVGLGIAAYEGVSSAMNAEETLGIKDRKATTGEKFAAGAGGILSGLTLGMVGADTIGNKLSKWFGAGPDAKAAPSPTDVMPAAPSPTAVMPGAKPIAQDKTKNLELVKAALEQQGITDPKMINATLANVMKETGGVSKEENLNYKNTSNDRIRSIFGSRAAGKSDAELNAIKSDPKQMGEMMYGAGSKIGQSMGNTEPGDGWKYRGRGFIQLTGKNNYAAASKAIYGDNRLVDNPDLVNDPAVAAQVSAWYMKKTQGSMAKKLGIDTANMTQDQANLLATSQVAGKAITPGSGYLGETLAKVNAYSAQTAAVAGAPTSADASKILAQTDAGTTGAAFMAAANPAASMISPEQRAMAQAGTPTSGPQIAQETPATLLSSLNNKMDQLISINRQLIAVNERQLSVQKSISSNGDLFVAT